MHRYIIALMAVIYSILIFMLSLFPMVFIYPTVCYAKEKPPLHKPPMPKQSKSNKPPVHKIESYQPAPKSSIRQIADQITDTSQIKNASNKPHSNHNNQADIRNIRIWPSPDSTRVVFDLSKAVQYTVTTRDNPARVEIELTNAKLQMDPALVRLDNSRIKNIKTTSINNKDLRIEFELARNLKPNVFTLTPNQQYGDRLVMDLEMDQNERDAILALFEADAPDAPSLPNASDLPNAPTASGPNVSATSNSSSASVTSPQMDMPSCGSTEVAPPPPAVKTLARKRTPFIIAIDPGHGGEDPGAVGKRGTKEKDVVLAISKHLKAMIDKEPNMHAVLIRTGDYYIALHERVKRARKHHADLFISIHADAFHDKRADGASVFTLSERGASSAAARWIAAHENRSDLIGGVKLSDKNKVLASVLLDLSQTKSKEEGYKAAKYVLSSLGKVGTLHGGRVEQAGFAVLKAPDIPSLLIETGFISNWNGEAKLRHSDHQRRIAKAILEGIRRYAAQRTH